MHPGKSNDLDATRPFNVGDKELLLVRAPQKEIGCGRVAFASALDQPTLQCTSPIPTILNVLKRNREVLGLDLVPASMSKVVTELISFRSSA